MNLRPPVFDGITVSSDTTLDDGFYRARTKEGWSEVRRLNLQPFPDGTVHVCLAPRDYAAVLETLVPDELWPSC